MALKVNKVVLIVLKLAVSSALLYFVLSKTGIGQVIAVLRNMSLLAFGSAIFLYLFAQMISTLRWKLLLPDVLGTRKLFSLYMIGSFFNTFLPGLIGGDAVKGFYLYKITGKGSLSLASIFMDRYIGFVALIVICALAFPFGYKYFHGSRVEWFLPATVLFFIIASLVFFGLRLGERIRFISEFYQYFYIYRNQKKVIKKALILSLVVQFAGFFSVYVLALGIGENIPFLSILIFLPLIILFTTLPVSISGLGLREGAFVLFFGLIGIKPEAAMAISLSWFISSSVGSLWGLIEYVKYKNEISNINFEQARR